MVCFFIPKTKITDELNKYQKVIQIVQKESKSSSFLCSLHDLLYHHRRIFFSLFCVLLLHTFPLLSVSFEISTEQVRLIKACNILNSQRTSSKNEFAV